MPSRRVFWDPNASGNGIVINAEGLVLTIGYLITEATDVWLTVHEGREIVGHALAYDQVTGFGLVMPLEKTRCSAHGAGTFSRYGPGNHGLRGELSPNLPSSRPFGWSRGGSSREPGNTCWMTPFSPHRHTPIGQAPPLIDDDGHLVGLGSLLVRETVSGEETNANMFVPIDLLKPILNDLATRGRTERKSRPWLGVYAVEVSGRVYVTGVADGSPAQVADIREGDLISHVGNQDVATLSEFYRRLWSLGPAGVAVPLTMVRGGTTVQLNVRSVDRTDLLKRPQAH